MQSPGSVIEADKGLEGLMFSFKIRSKSNAIFYIHNHNTVAASSAETGLRFSILRNIEYALGTDGEYTILEFKPPIDTLKIKSTNI